MACLLCSQNEAVIEVDGESFCDVCGSCYKCSDCGNYTEDIVEHDDANYCEDCFDAVFAECSECFEHFNRDDMKEVDGELFCDDCYDENFTTCHNCGEVVRDCVDVDGYNYCDDCSGDYFCEHCNEYHLEIEFIGNSNYCNSCRDANFTTCDECGEYVATDECICGDYNTLCQGCFEDGYFFCEGCDGLYSYNDSVETGNGLYCGDCAEDHCCTRSTGKPIKSDKFDIIKTDRWYGIEIETNSGDYDETSPRWGIHYDCSIGGMELVSPLLQGDEGLESIKRIYRRVNPSFDRRCGLHVHIDVRDLTDEERLEVVVAFKATKDKWFSHVSEERWSNRYCHHDLPEINGRGFAEYLREARQERYSWLNLDAVSKHGSIEIRLHEGTSNVGKVVKWVTMLMNFVAEVLEKRAEAVQAG